MTFVKPGSFTYRLSFVCPVSPTHVGALIHWGNSWKTGPVTLVDRPGNPSLLRVCSPPTAVSLVQVIQKLYCSLHSLITPAVRVISLTVEDLRLYD